MRQIRSTLIPILTEEQKYFNLLQEIIQQEKPGSDIFTVQGDEFDILKTTINNIQPDTEQHLRLRAIIAIMLDRASRTKDIRAINHHTIKINDRGNMLIQFALTGEHTTKEAKIRQRTSSQKRKNSAYFELTQ